MGYESRFYVVIKSCLNSKENGLIWADVLAMFDMSKVYCISNKIRDEFPDTDVYIYGDDGNSKITEDRYGEPLKEISLKDMVKLLEDAKAKLADCHMYKPFLKAMKAFVSEYRDYEGVVVLHYGY